MGWNLTMNDDVNPYAVPRTTSALETPLTSSEGIWRNNKILVMKITKTHIWLGGVHPSILDRLPHLDVEGLG